MGVIAIDGPAGSGKSTIARLLAERLGFVYLDTGAMYRAIAYLALRDGVALDDDASLAALARSAHLCASTSAGTSSPATRDVSDEIRRPAVSAAVSEVSAHAQVRDLLVAEQRRIAAGARRGHGGPRHRHRRAAPTPPSRSSSRRGQRCAPSGAARSSWPTASTWAPTRRWRRSWRATRTTRRAPSRRCAKADDAVEVDTSESHDRRGARRAGADRRRRTRARIAPGASPARGRLGEAGRSS